MKKLVLISLFFSFLVSSIIAQEIVLEKNVEDQYEEEKGPNTRIFGHLYVGGGGIADFDESNGTAINFWRSNQFLAGYRFKLKVLSFYSLGMDFNFKLDQYFMEGDDLNPFDPLNPLTFTTGEKKQTFTNNGIGLELWQRINIGKHGNSLGKYFDAGFRGQWNISDVEHLVIIYDNAEFIGRQRYYNRRLKYVEEFSYGLSGRIGFDKFMIHGFYRLSDLFKKEFAIPELPRLTIGAQFALY